MTSPAGARQAAAAAELARAAAELDVLAVSAGHASRALSDARARIAPLGERAQALLSGSSSGADRRMTSAVERATGRLGRAVAALDSAAAHARRAAAEASARARSGKR